MEGGQVVCCGVHGARDRTHLAEEAPHHRERDERREEEGDQSRDAGLVSPQQMGVALDCPARDVAARVHGDVEGDDTPGEDVQAMQVVERDEHLEHGSLQEGAEIVLRRPGTESERSHGGVSAWSNRREVLAGQCVGTVFVRKSSMIHG